MFVQLFAQLRDGGGTLCWCWCVCVSESVYESITRCHRHQLFHGTDDDWQRGQLHVK